MEEGKKNVVVLRYNAGNIQSVLFALERLGVHAVLTDNHDKIKNASHVIFPGVGEASAAMNHLRREGLDCLIPSLKQPVLGICLGMQLMCRFSEEGNTPCLGIFETEVHRFRGNLKVPQVGWNTISGLESVLFSGLEENCWQYFVHSYYAAICANTVAATEYIHPFSSALHLNNFYGVQFHPEKSGDAGSLILKNFLNL